MTRFTTRALALITIALAIAFVAAGCGSSKDDGASGTSGDSASQTGRLTHSDGVIKLSGTTLTLTPVSGGGDTTFKLGPEVQHATVQALIAANGRARVFYEAGSKAAPRLAVSVEPAPSAGEGAKTYDGQVKRATDTSITISGKDGDRTFSIESKDLPAFDIPHLNEHKKLKSAVRIYYRGSGASAHAVAYEDA